MTQGVAEVVAAGASTPSHTAPQPRKIAGGTGVHVRRSHIQRAHICRQHTHTASKQARGPTNRPLYQLLDLLAMQPRRCLTRGPGQPQLQAQRRSDNQPLAQRTRIHRPRARRRPSPHNKQASQQAGQQEDPPTHCDESVVGLWRCIKRRRLARRPPPPRPLAAWEGPPATVRCRHLTSSRKRTEKCGSAHRPSWGLLPFGADSP